MESLVEGMLKLKLCDDGSGDSNTNILWLEQLKTFDSDGIMRSVYPSKVDFVGVKDVEVERIE